MVFQYLPWALEPEPRFVPAPKVQTTVITFSEFDRKEKASVRKIRQNDGLSGLIPSVHSAGLGSDPSCLKIKYVQVTLVKVTKKS